MKRTEEKKEKKYFYVTWTQTHTCIIEAENKTDASGKWAERDTYGIDETVEYGDKLNVLKVRKNELKMLGLN